MKKQVSRFIYLCVLAIGVWSCQPAPAPVNGAPGIGDSYYPDLGNGGYDVQNYKIILDVNPETNAVIGKTIVEAEATESLSSFNLDFQKLAVDNIIVNKKEAAFTLTNQELVVIPSKPLPSSKSFTVEVNYHGGPTNVLSQALPVYVGWFHAKDGTINVLTEPDGASTWFPNDNHPRDKATYHFEITVPKPWVVAANGVLKETKENGDKTTFIWDMDQPMASYLAAIDIGKYDLETAKGPDDIIIRNYFPTDYPENLRRNFDALPKMIEYLSSLYGPYPFKEYGVVIASAETAGCSSGGADETQSLSIHCPTPSMADERVIVHELAHQWFGDSVSLANWKDVWLKEGMATYVEWQWITRDKDLKTLTRVVKAQTVGYYPSSATGNPPPDDLYRNEIYTGGALVIHALRLKVGDELFFKIMRTYLEQYKGKSAGTADFIAVAEKVSGEDLKSFFDSWLLDNKLPSLP